MALSDRPAGTRRSSRPLPPGAERFSTTADGALHGDLDLEATVALVPPEYTTKGMFFRRYVAALGAEWEELLPSLSEPAKHGQYQAFVNYPVRDYVRVFERVARARFPGSTREAFRLLARGEVEVFAGSTLGKVTFSLLRDPGAALLRYPDVMRSMVRGPELTAERLGARRVAITNLRQHGAVEHGLGLVEGVVQAFEEQPRVEVTVDADRRVLFDVSW